MKNPGIFEKINAYLYDDTRALDRIYNNASWLQRTLSLLSHLHI
jgi:hypothetical protein